MANSMQLTMLRALVVCVLLSATAVFAVIEEPVAFESTGGQLIASNSEFFVKGVGWNGFESSYHVAGGLHMLSMSTIGRYLKDHSFNTLLVALSGDTVLLNPRPHTHLHISNGVDSATTTSLEVLDALVHHMSLNHLFVLLDFAKYGAAVNVSEKVDLVWKILADRYCSQPSVIGVVLNRAYARWDLPFAVDLESTGNAVLSQCPRWLIFATGSRMLALSNPKRLVYAPEMGGPLLMGDPFLSAPTSEASAAVIVEATESVHRGAETGAHVSEFATFFLCLNPYLRNFLGDAACIGVPHVIDQAVVVLRREGELGWHDESEKIWDASLSRAMAAGKMGVVWYSHDGVSYPLGGTLSSDWLVPMTGRLLLTEAMPASNLMPVKPAEVMSLQSYLAPLSHAHAHGMERDRRGDPHLNADIPPRGSYEFTIRCLPIVWNFVRTNCPELNFVVPFPFWLTRTPTPTLSRTRSATRKPSFTRSRTPPPSRTRPSLTPIRTSTRTRLSPTRSFASLPLRTPSRRLPTRTPVVILRTPSRPIPTRPPSTPLHTPSKAPPSATRSPHPRFVVSGSARQGQRLVLNCTAINPTSTLQWFFGISYGSVRFNCFCNPTAQAIVEATIRRELTNLPVADYFVTFDGLGLTPTLDPCVGITKTLNVSGVCVPNTSPTPTRTSTATLRVPSRTRPPPSARPVTPSLRRVTPSLRPATPSLRPITPSSRPVTPSLRPVTPPPPPPTRLPTPTSTRRAITIRSATAIALRTSTRTPSPRIPSLAPRTPSRTRPTLKPTPSGTRTRPVPTRSPDPRYVVSGSARQGQILVLDCTVVDATSTLQWFFNITYGSLRFDCFCNATEQAIVEASVQRDLANFPITNYLVSHEGLGLNADLDPCFAITKTLTVFGVCVPNTSPTPSPTPTPTPIGFLVSASDRDGAVITLDCTQRDRTATLRYVSDISYGSERVGCYCSGAAQAALEAAIQSLLVGYPSAQVFVYLPFIGLTAEQDPCPGVTKTLNVTAMCVTRTSPTPTVRPAPTQKATARTSAARIPIRTPSRTRTRRAGLQRLASSEGDQTQSHSLNELEGLKKDKQPKKRRRRHA